MTLTVAPYEIIDSPELAKRWLVPVSWIRAHSHRSYRDPIPHVRLGKYVRFEWNSPELNAWFERQRYKRGSKGREEREGRVA